MNILITICARSGSKGIPQKNIRTLAGKPVISYSIEHAKRFQETYGGELVLSTDSDRIKEVAKKYGLDSDYKRPAHLATDSAGKIEVLRHLLLFYEKKLHRKFDYILDLDVSSPLRMVKEVEDAFNILQNDEKAYNIFSVSPARRNPYFNMVEEKNNGYFHLIKKKRNILSRQIAPEVFDLNASFYIYKRIFFEKNFKTAITNSSLIYRMNHICFDLDEPLDFEIMEFLIEKHKLDFTL